METLVEAAKRLGIKPNPNMTSDEKDELFRLLRKELGFYCSPSNIYESRKNVQLRAQNEFLRAQVMSAFPSVVVKTAKNHGKS